MAVWDTLATTAAGAVLATAGVLVGGMVTHRAQDRQWLRDKQLAAYEDLLREYAKFMMDFKRGHADRRPTDYDWADWSAALVSASLVAPSAVAAEIDNFGRAIDPFLAAVGRNTFDDPFTEKEFSRASLGPAEAQRVLVNAIRRSLGKDQGPLQAPIGGSLVRPENWPAHGDR
jgi:hypothetical protein